MSILLMKMRKSRQEEANFLGFGKKGRARREARREARKEDKEERRDKKNERKIARIEAGGGFKGLLQNITAGAKELIKTSQGGGTDDYDLPYKAELLDPNAVDKANVNINIPKQPGEKDNTALYIGIGIGVLVLAAAAYFFIIKK